MSRFEKDGKEGLKERARRPLTSPRQTPANIEQRVLEARRKTGYGRKGYNGRVERSHRSDDEEFYIPFLLSIQNEQQLLERAAGWEYFFNLVRPHYEKGMEGETPFEKLKELGYDLPEEFAVFPPIILDTISTDWLLETGNDLLAHYKKYGLSSSERMFFPSLGVNLAGS